MLDLRKSKIEEVSQFVNMERSDDTSKYVIPYSAERHITEMKNEKVVYLSIFYNQMLVGFIILAIESSNNVEFRRIVVSAKGKGLGQLSIQAMEKYCIAELNCHRVWLDVFEANSRGLYIYKKLGYKQFKSGELNSNLLLYMEKTL